MNAFNLYSRDVRPTITVPECATIEQAASLMSFAGLPAVVLAAADGHPIGVLGRTELVAAIAAGAHHPTALAEASLCLDGYPQIDCEASPGAVLRLALSRGCETVMFTKAGKIVGFLDLVDILAAVGSAPPY